MKRKKAKTPKAKSAPKAKRASRRGKKRSAPSRQTPEAQSKALKRFKPPTKDQLNTSNNPDPHYY